MADKLEQERIALYLYLRDVLGWSEYEAKLCVWGRP